MNPQISEPFRGDSTTHKDLSDLVTDDPYDVRMGLAVAPLQRRMQIPFVATKEK